jgi:adenine-specific DNA glycosylase
MAGFWDLPAAGDLPAARPGSLLGEIRHTITHHHYTFTVRRADLSGRTAAPFRWWNPADLPAIPLSTTARKALTLAGIISARSRGER